MLPRPWLAPRPGTFFSAGRALCLDLVTIQSQGDAGPTPLSSRPIQSLETSGSVVVVTNIPVLPSRDLDRSAAFYARLGYRAHRRYPDYLILSGGAAELHLALMPLDPSRNPAGVYLRVQGVDEIAQAVGAVVKEKPWGQREFSISDPDENLIRVGEETSALEL